MTSFVIYNRVAVADQQDAKRFLWTLRPLQP
jgi:hypothetical protein